MMLEVCRYSEASTAILDEDMMKHSAPNIEVFEFNLGQAPFLRCVISKNATACSECETCKLNARLREIKQWFPRLGDHSRKRFMLGLIQRTHSAELLNQVVKLLQPILYKDFTYSRSRSNPSLPTDSATLSGDRALPPKDVDRFIASTWTWFKDANYWSKANFALGLLQMCDAHLLHTVGTQARTLLVSEVKAAEEFADAQYTERASISSSNYTYRTDEHPSLELLTSVGQQYGEDNINPFTGEEFPILDLGDMIENDLSDEDYSEIPSESSMDPAYMVIPTSAKAYAGVSKHIDLIRMLPIHISKQILSLLDKGSLMNALCVSSFWRTLVEEVYRDFYINQQLLEEVMLMQKTLRNKEMAVYPLGEIKLTDNYELAERHSWDVPSMLKLVKLEMQMKYREFNDKILDVIDEHLTEVENYEKFYKELYERKGDGEEEGEEEDKVEGEGVVGGVTGIGETDEHAKGESTEGEETEECDGEEIEEEEEVLDQMLDKVVDYLDIMMPNLNLNLPKVDPQGNTRKVQFSVRPPGAAAQGANPVYAKDIDVLVPNIDYRTSQVIRTDDAVIKTTFKSEVSFDTAYSGVATRKVIMEERNVYCGPYNVLVLCDHDDPHRVFHTDGGKLISIGSKDRKVRFIDNTTGHEHKRMTKGESADGELPVITGHAGSIRCVCIIEEKGLVLSGSYDTSIRMWSVNTGHCLRIFRGHRDTVMTIRVLDDLLISGSKDRSCKVWDLNTGKCHRSFRHRYPVIAVAMSTDRVITGCEGGKVKVWELRTGRLIKVLNGHHEGVTAIQFDRYHIVTGGKDGYALVWSAIGDHNRCLSALRHPKEVLCLEFVYLRCITGSADGRIRIWNIITGQCCRIMRGNSRSDPILNIIAIDNRITINTAINLLVLNFEEVEWNYNLEDDKVPPLVQYSSYSDSPVRQQPYPYIRAQRMKKAGATNTKILHKSENTHDAASKPPMSQLSHRAPQIPHSAKTLSAKSIGSARVIQNVASSAPSYKESRGTRSANFVDRQYSSITRKSQLTSAQSKPPLPSTAKSRPTTSKSGQSGYSVTIMDETFEQEMDEEYTMREPIQIKRRISWAFETPAIPANHKEMSLSETQALLRSQMRMKNESVVPPDFIYLTVNAIHNSLKPTETSANTELNTLDSKKIQLNTRLRENRPSSSPSKIDPRTRIPTQEIDMSQFIEKEVKDTDTLSEVSFKSIKSTKSKDSHQIVTKTVDKEVFSTKCHVKPLKTAPKISIHPKHIRTTLPKARIIRPISASVTRKEPLEQDTKPSRPITAPLTRVRPDTASTIPSQIAASLPGVQPQRKKQVSGISTLGNEANVVPMLMYPPDMKEKLAAKLKEKRQQRHDDMLESASEVGVGKVSQYNDPMRSHIKFELRTHNQERNYIIETEKLHKETYEKEEALIEKRKRVLWTAKAKGHNIDRTRSAPH